jgi:hypothetical protein
MEIRTSSTMSKTPTYPFVYSILMCPHPSIQVCRGRRHRRSPNLQNLRCTSAKEGCLIFKLTLLEQSPSCGAKPETMRSQRHISVRYEDLSAECTGNCTRAHMCMESARGLRRGCPSPSSREPCTRH